MAVGNNPSSPTLTPAMAVVTIMKSMIGVGVLALPWACGSTRLAISVPGLLVVASLCTWGTWQLIECRAIISKRESGDSGCQVRYGDGGLGPVGLFGNRVFGRAGLCVVGFAILSTQFGAGTAYVEFMTQTTRHLTDHSVSTWVVRFVFWLILCMLSFVRTLGNLAWLSAFGLGVYVVVVIVLIKCGSDRLYNGESPPFTDAWTPLRWSGVGRLLGTSIFAFEGVVLAQYVYDEMKYDDPAPFWKVLVTSNFLAFLIYLFVGSFGYIVYGDCVKALITSNLPPGSLDVVIVESTLIVVLIFTYVLQLYPVFGFVESLCLCSTEQKGPEEPAPLKVVEAEPATQKQAARMPSFLKALCQCSRPQKAGSSVEFIPLKNSSQEVELEQRTDQQRVPNFWMSTAIRFSVVTITFVSSICIPNLGTLTGYVGAFSLGTLGFVLPGVAHIKVKGSELTFVEVCVDVVLVAVGLLAMVLTVVNTLSGPETRPAQCSAINEKNKTVIR